jgi:hypothetical protein
VRRRRDVDPLKLVSPAYVAVNAFAPALVNVRLHVPAATVPTQLIVPSLTVTLPVGVPLPGALTVTLKVTGTGWPTTDGSGVSAVIVGRSCWPC